MHRTVGALCVLVLVVLLVLLALVVASAIGLIEGGSVFGGAGPARLYVRDFKHALAGEKTIEVRAAGIPYLKHINPDTEIVVVRGRDKDDKTEMDPYKFTAKVVSVTEYKDFATMLNAIKLTDAYPTAKTPADATKEYEKFLPKDKTLHSPVVAIKFHKGAAMKKKTAHAGGLYDGEDVDPW